MSFVICALCSVSFADDIHIKFDTAKGHDDSEGAGAIGAANLNVASFSSRAFKDGSLIRNRTGKTITGLYIKLKDGHTIKKDSSGGKAFPMMELSKARDEITFSGGNVKPNQLIWSEIPLSADFPSGKGKYEGNAVAAVKVEQKKDSDETDEALMEKLSATMKYWDNPEKIDRDKVLTVQAYGEDPSGSIRCIWTGLDLFISHVGSENGRAVVPNHAIHRGINRIRFRNTTEEGPAFELWHNGSKELVVPINKSKND